MTVTRHANLAAGRWNLLTLSEQLGNVGSEVGRAVSWRERGDASRSALALDRALELLDLTIADKRWREPVWPGRLKELARAREFLCASFFDPSGYSSTPEAAEKYFFHFAIAARAGR